MTGVIMFGERPGWGRKADPVERRACAQGSGDRIFEKIFGPRAGPKGGNGGARLELRLLLYPEAVAVDLEVLPGDRPGGSALPMNIGMI